MIHEHPKAHQPFDHKHHPQRDAHQDSRYGGNRGTRAVLEFGQNFHRQFHEIDHYQEHGDRDLVERHMKLNRKALITAGRIIGSVIFQKIVT